MTEIDFMLSPVDMKPSRRHKKGSKYDPILDAFLKSPNELVSVSVEGKNCNYLRMQLKKRVDERELGNNIAISVVNGGVYLEKL